MTRKPREPKRGLRFNENVHRYWLDGKPIPGVTTAIGVLNKEAIPYWAAGQVAEFVADNPETVERLRGMGRETIVNALKRVPWEKRDKAASRGSILHAHAEGLLLDEEIEVEAEHAPVISGALDFLAEWRVTPILVEFACASRKDWWAGTGDLIAEYTRPDTNHTGVAIFDWKSGKRLYPDFSLQLAAYAGAEFHGLDGNEQPMPETDAAFGVHIGPDGYQVAEFKSGPDVYQDFLTVRNAFDVAKRVRGNWRVEGSGFMSAPITTTIEETA